jgi:thymidylate kinase
MLIVDGPDGVGKTAFCRMLLEKLPAHVYSHFTKLPPEFDYYWGYAERMSRHVVQDRFHVSQPCYAAARGEEPFGLLVREGYRLVDARLTLLGGLTVLLTADPRLLEDRWHAGQMYALERTIEAARWFDRIAAGEFPWINVDFHHRSSERELYATNKFLDRVLEEYSYRQRLIADVSRRRQAPL